MRDEIKTVTLTELSGIGSVDVDENGAFTLNFMNLSIRMCEKRLYVLAAMLKDATLTVTKAKVKAKSEENDPARVLMDMPFAQEKKILN